ncbi:ADP-ribosylglycohydrolase family protein [Actinocorallia sp. B10E7]|uniref:ADP-ribosylglycohydrolase family protein n=1 Tax=Actinocorallia sp. B10E7 TaxID=3153558 RepID=UPI00325D30A7
MSWSWQEQAAFRARVRGCLLGGALGDALGHPVEQDSLAEIRRKHGPDGVVGPASDTDGRVGLVSDGTQMTLFTAEGLIRAAFRLDRKGFCDPVEVVLNALLRWLETQNSPRPAPPDGVVRTGWLREQEWLYARRAPDSACLSALETRRHPGPHDGSGAPGPVNPGSQGCGGVTRSAPFGIACPPDRAFDLAVDCARLTHGHPAGYYSAGAFATIIAHLMAGESLRGAVLQTLERVHGHPGHKEVADALQRALDLANKGGPSPEKVESLGEGRVAQEALAIAVYCALAEPVSAAGALILAVNHGGDSGSTGSMCGSLVGVRHGDFGLPSDWLALLEGRGAVTELADDFATQFMPGSRTPDWSARYPAC